MIDTYFGNQANFQLDRFDNIIALAEDKYGGEFGNDLWADERVTTYQNAKDTNPEVNTLSFTT